MPTPSADSQMNIFLIGRLQSFIVFTQHQENEKPYGRAEIIPTEDSDL